MYEDLPQQRPANEGYLGPLINFLSQTALAAQNQALWHDIAISIFGPQKFSYVEASIKEQIEANASAVKGLVETAAANGLALCVSNESLPQVPVAGIAFNTSDFTYSAAVLSPQGPVFLPLDGSNTLSFLGADKS